MNAEVNANVFDTVAKAMSFFMIHRPRVLFETGPLDAPDAFRLNSPSLRSDLMRF